jgi:hypothetical protein
MCQIRDIMQKDENYVRGVIRLENPAHDNAVHLAQYALDLQKLRHKHEGACPDCQREDRI